MVGGLLRRVIQNLGVPSINVDWEVVTFGLWLESRTGSLTHHYDFTNGGVTTEEALHHVRYSQVGATKWQTVRYHVVPNSIAGITTGGNSGYWRNCTYSFCSRGIFQDYFRWSFGWFFST